MKRAITITLFLVPFACVVLAQDLIIPKQGNPIAAYNVDASKSFVYYSLEQGVEAQLLRIVKDSVLMVRKADGTVMDLGVTEAPAKPLTNYPVINEADIHGSLIAQGNKVFIPTDSPNEAERAGQELLKKRVQEWNYWTVADVLEQAHFVLQYMVDYKGKDYSVLIIRPRSFYKKMPSVDFDRGNIGFGVAKCKTNDSDPKINRTISNVLFNHLKKLVSDPDYDKKVKKYSGRLYDEYYGFTASEYFYHYISKMTAEGKNNVTQGRTSIPTLEVRNKLKYNNNETLRD